MSPRFIRFVVSGGIAAAVNVLSRIALSTVMGYSAAIVISFLIGMTTGFLLMKFLVFERSGRGTGGEYLRFTLVNLLALVQVWGVSIVLARYVFPVLLPAIAPETPAHVIGVLSPVVTSYLLHEYFTFRRAEPR